MILKRNSVLEDLKIERNGISIEELPFVNKINLRGNTTDRIFMSNTGSVLDILIPTEPNTKIENKNLQVIWLSPNEWLLNFIYNENFTRIFENLSNKLNPENTSITDISESKTIIRVGGIHTTELLRKFLILDIDSVLNSNLKVAQTIFVKVPILIVRNHKDQDTQSFDIHLNRSHTTYLKDLLLDGCNQFIN
jgi:sarcosine oxidase subunit gamma|tara:strand:+ start:160 stop:738 length:579 start_codon:yes stop_codon:yes gene_type:complete